MPPESVRRLRKWARRRRTPLAIGSAALVLVAVAGYVIYDAATEPIVGADTIDGSGPLGTPTPSVGTPPGATGDVTDIGGGGLSLPTGGFSAGCGIATFTMSITSDVPIAIAGYVTSAGEQDYFPQERTGTVTVQQCPTDPSVLVIGQAGPTATTITCTTTKSGQVVETRTTAGANGLVYCYG